AAPGFCSPECWISCPGCLRTRQSFALIEDTSNGELRVWRGYLRAKGDLRAKRRGSAPAFEGFLVEHQLMRYRSRTCEKRAREYRTRAQDVDSKGVVHQISCSSARSCAFRSRNRRPASSVSAASI